MLVATLGPSTAWVGKKITHKRGSFALDGYGKISAADVVAYDRQGVLQWPDVKMRAWVWECLTPTTAATSRVSQPPKNRVSEPPKNRVSELPKKDTGPSGCSVVFACFMLGTLALGIIISLVTLMWPITVALCGIFVLVWAIWTVARRR